MIAMVFVSLLASAHATDFNLNSGNYGDSKRFYESTSTHLKLAKKGDEIRVIDQENSIVYSLNLANSNEQVLNPKLLELLRTSAGSRVLGHLITKISLTDTNVDSAGKLTTNFNLDIKSISPFGTIEARLQIGAEATSSNCQIEKSSQNPKTFQTIVQAYQGTCLHYELGTQAGVVSFNSGFPDDINKGLAMAADLIFKLYSPLFAHGESFYEHR